MHCTADWIPAFAGMTDKKFWPLAQAVCERMRPHPGPLPLGEGESSYTVALLMGTRFCRCLMPATLERGNDQRIQDALQAKRVCCAIGNQH